MRLTKSATVYWLASSINEAPPTIIPSFSAETPHTVIRALTKRARKLSPICEAVNRLFVRFVPTETVPFTTRNASTSLTQPTCGIHNIFVSPLFAQSTTAAHRKLTFFVSIGVNVGTPTSGLLSGFRSDRSYLLAISHSVNVKRHVVTRRHYRRLFLYRARSVPKGSRCMYAPNN